MVSTIKQLGGEVRNLRRFASPDDKLWSAFNPSIGVSPSGKYAMTIRSSNYVILPHGELSVTTGDKIANKVWFAELDDNLQLENMRVVDFAPSGWKMRRGVEDGKLLWREGNWMFTGVALERDIPVARHCECYMNSDATAVDKLILFPGVSSGRPEKNWMTASNKPANFDYVYNGNAIIKDDLVISRLRESKVLAGLRGNTHLLELGDGTYLGLMHKLIVSKKQIYIPSRFLHVDSVYKNYHHFFVRVDENGWIVEVSAAFQFVSPGIEFAAGIVEKNGNYVISFGKDDVSSHIAIIEKSKVLKLLKKIDCPS